MQDGLTKIHHLKKMQNLHHVQLFLNTGIFFVAKNLHNVSSTNPSNPVDKKKLTFYSLHKDKSLKD